MKDKANFSNQTKFTAIRIKGLHKKFKLREIPTATTVHIATQSISSSLRFPLLVNDVFQALCANGHNEEVSVTLRILPRIENRNDVPYSPAYKILGNVKLAVSCQVFSNSNVRYAELIEADPSWMSHTVSRLTT